MGFNFTHNPRKIYRIVTGIWLFLFVAVASLIITLDTQRAERLFYDHANSHYQQANDRVHINESVLEGFAAMVGTSNYLDHALIRTYVQKMLKQYPYIFKFEIVEKVPDDKLDAFSQYYRQNFYPDFKVGAFSYESDRQWQSARQVPEHLLIVFMEPMTEDSKKILGLDIGSNEIFVRSFRESEQQDRMLSTDPFTLVQGPLAYLLLRPVNTAGVAAQSAMEETGADGGFVELVILADTLLDRGGHALPGMRELLYNPSFDSTDPAGYLHLHEAPQPGWLESLLFPCLSVRWTLDSDSQPFVLLMEQQLGWSLISWGKLVMTLLIALITFAVMVVYARLYFRNEMERAEATVRLFHLANHDTLTGLANRNLLSDRLNHAITQTARQKGRLAVLFLDLEDFKDVNDSYGHDTGDAVLKRAAERLRASVRAGDTIARPGGDEFVIVLGNISSRADIDQVVEKIKAGFERPFDVNSRSITVGISIGTATYPEDGTDIEALISCADSAMYIDKRCSE